MSTPHPAIHPEQAAKPAIEFAKVPLTRGLVTLVDVGDYERVMDIGSWFARRNKRAYYATRNVTRPDGTRGLQHLHQFLTGRTGIDHINGDSLDNRRSNLRRATTMQNNWNRGRRSDNTSGFKGVSWNKARHAWCAQIEARGTRRVLGYHAAADDAARAYDAAARELHGEFASLNFPLPGERAA